MFRKFLKRSIPFLVAALVLIGTVAVPAQAAFYVPFEDNQNMDFSPYYSYLKFNVEAYNANGDLIGFSMPSSYNLTYDTLRSDTFVYPELGFMENYRVRLLSERHYHSYLMDDGSDPSQLYLKHDLEFDYQGSPSYAPGTDFIPTDITYTFDDFVLMLSDVNWGSAFFLCNVPEGWFYTLSYDYYYVTPVTYDVHYTKNVISEKHEQFLRGQATGDMERALVRDYDYDLMIEQGADPGSLVLITNAVFSLFAPDDVDASAANHYFYAGYGEKDRLYPLSWFYLYNDLNFDEVVYVDKVVEVPVFDVGITNFLTNGVGGFLDADIFGTFSIGDLLAILISVFFVVYLLKFLS